MLPGGRVGEFLEERRGDDQDAFGLVATAETVVVDSEETVGTGLLDTETVRLEVLVDDLD